jgi:hypothetical protein
MGWCNKKGLNNDKKKQRKTLMQNFWSVKVSLQKMNRKAQKQFQSVKVVSL